MTDLVEALARAMVVSDGYDPDFFYPPDTADPVPIWRAYRERVRACLAALESAGYRVVPIEPTLEMLRIAGKDTIEGDYLGWWAAMLANAWRSPGAAATRPVDEPEYTGITG